MNEMVVLRGVDPREILQTAVDKKVPAIMSYLSKGKWHVAKVLLTELGADRFSIESTHLEKRPHPINIQMNQPVGISFKYEYGKFVFDTTVADLEPSSDSASGGTIVLAVPDRVEVVQRRSYFRVNVPESLRVNVVLWHRSQKDLSILRSSATAKDEPERQTSEMTSQTHNYYQGILVDISAGGAQVIVDAGQAPVSSAQVPDFKKGQFIGLRLTPLPYEMPLMFNAQIRNILPTADNKSVYLGLQIVGLESSREGRQVLSRIVGVVERYYRMNQPGRLMIAN
ncbi:MAG: PilZ domain-containing protein [Planctomycetota bacterium]|nr:PilZ domain-containing protein [Planctomycetota bacterium]